MHLLYKSQRERRRVTRTCEIFLYLYFPYVDSNCSRRNHSITVIATDALSGKITVIILKKAILLFIIITKQVMETSANVSSIREDVVEALGPIEIEEKPMIASFPVLPTAMETKFNLVR